jgi:hypothetical protein
MILTGGLNLTISYSTPPPCYVVGQSQPSTLSSAVEVYTNVGTDSAFVQIMMRGWYGAGAYAANANGNESYVLFNAGGNAAESWMSVDGTIYVRTSSPAVISGTVDADLVWQGSNTASYSRGATAHVSGTWACIPPPGS